MALHKVLVSERIADEGIALLKQHVDLDYQEKITREELLEVIGNYDALVVRSVTQVDEELVSRAPKLKVVGRAGNGVDNINIPVCTRYGIVVVNTPDSNTVSAAEQTIALLLASIRNLPWANSTLKGGSWDRKPFRGMELYGKTVGIVGLGRIGSMVAMRLRSFNMEVIAYDPYITDERFERFGVRKVDKLEDIARLSDIITVHTPRNEETIHMLDEKFFALAKDGVRVVNCARGGIIKESVLLAGIKSGKIGSAGLDVYETEPAIGNPLFEFNNVVCTPHLGADTFEAQKRVGENIAEEVIKALAGEIVPNTVNLPSVLREELNYLSPYMDLAEKIGSVYYQLDKPAVNRIELTYSGPISNTETEMLTVSFLKGLLAPVMNNQVNYVNAQLLAEERGIQLFIKKEGQSPKRYKNLIQARLFSNDDQLYLAGTLSRARFPLLVEIDEYETESDLQGYVVMVENEDRPRVIGPMATTLGDENINIASMKVARRERGTRAVMMVNVDNKVEPEILDKLGKLDGILQTPKLLYFG